MSPTLLILIFFGAFLGSVIGVRWLAPDAYVSYFWERLTVFESQKDDYNLIFIGSSHYRSAFDPEIFDRMTSEAGYHTRSFNFSLPAMHLPETLHVISRIRALRPANLKWVVVEPRMKVHIRAANDKKQRLIYYHDLPATLMAFKGTYHRAEPARDRFPHYWRHIRHFAYRLTNQGLARSLISELYTRNSPNRVRQLQRVFSGQGYNALKGEHPAPVTCDRFFFANHDGYEKDVRKFTTGYRQSPLKPELAELLARLLREVEALGARPIFLFAPVMESPYDLALPDDAAHVDVIRLDDVARYPELFAAENRWDKGHMNYVGAELSTAAAAEAFLRIATGKDGR